MSEENLKPKNYRCLNCGHKYYDMDKVLYNCPSCGGILDINYDYSRVSYEGFTDKLHQMPRNLWDYSQLLPTELPNPDASLGEGGTPLTFSDNLSKALGTDNLFLKNETLNPSGSFKDRPISVALTKGKELGYNNAITASSGSAGSALATYSSFLSLPSLILVPENTPAEKIAQMQISASTLVKVKGHYSQCFSLAQEISSEENVLNVTSTYFNPFATEGDKTIAYEIYHQLDHQVPNWILIPVGAGPLLYGCYKGFKELRKIGYISRLPKMVAVQAKGCAPIAKAFQKGSDIVKQWGTPDTVASSIADPLHGYSQDGTQTLKTVRKSRGEALMIEDQEILDSTKMLMKKTGIFAEPTGAISLAGLKKLISKGVVDNSDLIICVITGSGYKDIESCTSLTVEPPLINPNKRELLEIIKSEEGCS